MFLDDANTMLTKKSRIILKMSITATHYHRESNPQPLYHPAAGYTSALPVCCLFVNISKFCNLYRRLIIDQIFAKTFLFENCSCFSKIPFSVSVESPRIFQCLILIPASHWVRQIDGDLPRRFFLSALLNLVINMTGPNNPQERCAMARTSCARL